MLNLQFAKSMEKMKDLQEKSLLDISSGGISTPRTERNEFCAICEKKCANCEIHRLYKKIHRMHSAETRKEVSLQRQKQEDSQNAKVNIDHWLERVQNTLLIYKKTNNMKRFFTVLDILISALSKAFNPFKK